jgi:hypothetical protein
MPWQCHQTVGIEVVVKSEMGLGTTVVDIVGYPVEVAEALDHKDTVATACGILHVGAFVWMQTALAGADVVGIVVMSYALLLEVHIMIALAAGIFHQGVFTVSPLFAALIQRMGELLEESAVATIYHVVVFVNGQLLLAKLFVTSLNDIVTHQTALVVAFPVRGIGSPVMLFCDYLSAIQTFLVVQRIGPLVVCGLDELEPCINAIHLVEIVGLLLGEFASLRIAIVLVRSNVLGRQWLVF